MSEDGFHVHGPHEHALEHAGHGEPGEHGARLSDGLAGRIAVTTAILSTVGAIFSYQGGFTQNEALLYKNNSILYKNESVLKKTQASDQWAYYQAKGNKQNLAEFASAIAPADKRAFYAAEAERYKTEKQAIKVDAEKLEAEVKKYNDLSAEADRKSAESMHPHERFALATTLVQIAIALAAITVLTQKVWLFWGAGIAAGAGIVLWVMAGGIGLLAHMF